MTAAAEFLGTPGGIAVQAALVAAFLDFFVGVWRAYQDEQLALDAIGAFIRKHLLGRVFPLTLLVVAGYLTGAVQLNAAAAAALTVYYGETIASVWASISLPGSSRIPTD